MVGRTQRQPVAHRQFGPLARGRAGGALFFLSGICASRTKRLGGLSGAGPAIGLGNALGPVAQRAKRGVAGLFPATGDRNQAAFFDQ
ncbi:MAG: hypothetical protein QOH22_2159 [Gemmatimonadaceae bacterium]|nr:hypothetical protein [Gemmatimonadaceae bacterium]